MMEPDFVDEIVIDSFAGGGGTSEGIVAAIGRDPDIALNHDRFALAMHRVNHPYTKHLVEDVVMVDAVSMCDGKPIGFLWMSPDCKDHSKAKGGKPRDKNIRGLAWACFGWVKALPKWQRPRIVFLENVEEFRDWSVLLPNGKRNPLNKGEIFQQFVKAWEALGYVVEFRERRAWWSGAGTIRKRFYMIMRRDGEPIVWPEPTHGDPNDADDAAKIAAGLLQPWVVAADCIDFSLPCPSIFDTSAQIKEKYGLRANRPLAESTMARCAKGVMRYVVNAARPFIVPVTHTGSPRANSVDEPLRTITAAHRGEHAIVTPFVTKFQTGSTGHAVDEPLHTITAHASDTHGGGAAPLGIVTPVLVGCGGRAAQTEPRRADAPIITQTAKADLCLVAPYMVPRYRERDGQQPRTRSVEQPMATVVPRGNEGHVAAVHLATMRNSQKPFNEADRPVHTLTAGGANIGVVAAFLAQHNSERGGVKAGREVEQPISAITASGGQQSLVAAHMLTLRGSDRRHAPADQPLRTVSAEGNHAATVYAFLAKYYGAGLPSQGVDEPLHTVTTKPRHGLVTVTIGGEPYVITDIGMRMLTPRERFNAQGFRRDYIIDHGILEDGSIVRFTMEQQGYMCGNSVCPTEAAALIGANYKPRQVRRPRRDVAPAPLLEAAAS